jgi:hypothetical protein
MGTGPERAGEVEDDEERDHENGDDDREYGHPT